MTNKELKQKIVEIFNMWEVIYSKRKQLDVGVIRLWRLRKMKEECRQYLSILDLPDSRSYTTKKMIRDILMTHSAFESILSVLHEEE